MVSIIAFRILSPYICSLNKVIMIEFRLTEEYIELIKLLKTTQVAESGAQAKMMVEGKLVTRNGTVELRKRAKIRKGEMIEVSGQVIRVI